MRFVQHSKIAGVSLKTRYLPDTGFVQHWHDNTHNKTEKMEDTLLAVTNLMTVMNIAPDKNRQGGHRPGWCQAWG